MINLVMCVPAKSGARTHEVYPATLGAPAWASSEADESVDLSRSSCGGAGLAAPSIDALPGIALFLRRAIAVDGSKWLRNGNVVRTDGTAHRNVGEGKKPEPHHLFYKPVLFTYLFQSFESQTPLSGKLQAWHFINPCALDNPSPHRYSLLCPTIRSLPESYLLRFTAIRRLA